MLDFMVIGAPRSGTAWASVWLTDTYSFCQHDPLWDFFYEEVDQLAISHQSQLCGIACTGMANWPDWVNKHEARKVILHRPRAEVEESIRRLGKVPPAEQFFRNLDQIQGLHVPWTDLWEKPEAIYKHLLPGMMFDAVRHRMLSNLKIETRTRCMPDHIRLMYVRRGIHLRN